MKKFKFGKSICYSGYRDGQSPAYGIHPSYEEIKEDLLILDKEFDYIRMYSPSIHAVNALKVIRDNNLNLKMMLGVHLQGEESNPQCTWGGNYTKEQIKNNLLLNRKNIEDCIKLANEYEDIIFSVSAGNEAVPEWNENLVRPNKVLEYVKELKSKVKQPVTYCDGGYYWTTSLKEVAKEVDFISIHTYAVWNGYSIKDGLKIAKEDFFKVQEMYPNKYCIITETGWPTKSDGRKIDVNKVGEDEQKRYYLEINNWAKENNTLVFFFASFDSKWKGGGNPLDPEKNWGIYYFDRTPKKVLKK